MGTVGCVAHEAIEDGPGRAEDLRWWAVGWLLEGHVGLLGFFCCRREKVLVVCLKRARKRERLRLTENPTAVPRAIGRRIEAAGFWKTIAGSVMEGM